MTPMLLPRILAIALALACHAGAGEVFWTNNFGGIYSEPLNWSAGVPGSADTASFTNSSQFPVLFTNAAELHTARFFRGVVTQDIGAALWVVTNRWQVGEATGEAAKVVHTSGVLAVTNAGRSAILEVGRIGTGELDIRGGNIVADVLLATNLARSKLNHSHGSLTFLNGGVLSLGADFVVGQNPTNAAVWNLLGGNTTIVSPNFDYGSLTLGGGGRALLNVQGSGTVLSLKGLDVRPPNRHAITITDGAQFRTQRVQFGLNSSTSNSVFIAGPGSAWINSDLIYFGMHVGGQSLIVSNGGLFQAGPSGISDVFHFGGNANNRIIVTGSNSQFRSENTVEMGMVWCSPQCSLNNLVLITNGGSFFAGQLKYGSFNLGVSGKGNVIRVEDGTLTLGNLAFAVGTIQIENGTATIDLLSMTGGTNAVLQTRGALLMGHTGALEAGDLRVGSANANLSALNGDLIAGNWRLGASPGTVGQATLVGGRVFVTNSIGTATLTIGDSGAGSLRVSTGFVQSSAVELGRMSGSSGALIIDGPQTQLRTERLTFGAGGLQGVGTVIVTNSGILEANVVEAVAINPAQVSGTIQFTTNLPTLLPGSVVLRTGTVSFRNVPNAEVRLTSPSLGAMTRIGDARLCLINSTNLAVTALTLQSGDAASYADLVLENGTNRLAADVLTIASSGHLIASNTLATISGAVTNLGRIELVNSTIIFEGPVRFASGSILMGSGGRVVFMDNVHLPSTDLTVANGLSISLNGISSDGGKLQLNDAELEVRAGAPAFPAGTVLLSSGVVTYVNTVDAPVEMPPGLQLEGNISLRLINSSNAFLPSFTFQAQDGEYGNLLLTGGNDLWQSGRLTIGAGGSLLISNSAAQLQLSDGDFRVENGGTFIDVSSGSNYVGFAAGSSNNVATLSDTGSLWKATGRFFVGHSGSGNHLVLSNGAGLFCRLTEIGYAPSSTFNSARLVGSGTLWSNADTFAIGTYGTSNQLEVTEGPSIVSRFSNLGGAGGRDNVATIRGTNSRWITTNLFFISGSGNILNVQTGAVLIAGSLNLGGSGNQVLIQGPDANVQITNSVVVIGGGNTVQVRSGGKLLTTNLSFNATASNCLFEITGADSSALIKNALTLSGSSVPGTTNFILVSDSATVLASRLDMPGGTGSSRVLSAGAFIVTNATKTGLVWLRGGFFEQLAGSLRADQIVATNGEFGLKAGTVEVTRSEFAGNEFAIGEGVAQATLRLRGGTNLFRGGLKILPRGNLVGTGIVVGIASNSGALVIPAPGGQLTFAESLSFSANSTAVFSLNGPPTAGATGTLSVAGTLLLNGKLVVKNTNGFMPLPTDIYPIIRFGILEGTFSNVSGERVLTEDRLGSLRVFTVGSTLFLSDYQTEDVDGDTIQDTWAIQYFGITPLPQGNAANARNGDADTDGLTNYEEFRLGTNPLDAKSGILLRVSIHPSGVPALHFPFIEGREYRVHSSTDLVNCTSTAPTFVVDETGEGEWADRGGNTGDNRFYYISIQ